jgi:hypothetical protein
MATSTRLNPETPKVDLIDLLKTQRDGDLLYDAALELTRLVEAVRRTGKPGHVTIRLTCAPGAAGNGEKVAFNDRVDTKLPRTEYAPNIYYALEDGGISRANPNRLSREDRAGLPSPASAAGSLQSHPAEEN